ncbi:MAG: sulfatase-like hydrolase/transferase, partial [Bacteroidales bacterium]|nr:sulfatase-like hydrolase/transferase [Bacteroidales bacterium]
EKANYDTAKQVIWDEVLGNFHDFISKREKGQPFFYWFGPYHTHRQWVKGSGKAIWGIKPNDLEGKLPLDWPDVFEVREDVSDYLGEIQAFDYEVGIFYNELEKMGELDNTIIILTGDNGIPGLPRAKRNLYDKGVHAPLIIRWGEKVAPNRQVLDFVNLMDLAPTIIAASRGKIPAGVDGESIMNLLLANDSGQIDRKRNHVITMRERHVKHYPMRAIRTDEFLYIRNFKTDRYPAEITNQIAPGPWIFIDEGPTRKYLVDNITSSDVWPYLEMAFKKRPIEELYDLTNDPMQIFNVANEPDYEGVKTKLAKKLEKELRAKGDPRYLGEDWLDKAPYVKN